MNFNIEPRPTRFVESCTGRILLALLLILLADSTTAQVQDGRVRSLAEIRYERVIPQKWDTSCGAAALATLLTYDLNHPITEREVASAMLHRTDPVRVRTRGGFSLLNMQEFAEAQGYQADGYGELTLQDLLPLLPAIVPVQFHGYDHFVVVRRVRDGKVDFADPAFGRRTVPAARFEQAWILKIALVVSPNGKTHHTID